MLDLLTAIHKQVLWIGEQMPSNRLVRYWHIGECLSTWNVEEERELLVALSSLLQEKGQRIRPTQWRQMCRVYAAFPKGVDTRLTWTHYCRLAQLTNYEKRTFYEQAAAQTLWTTADLTRQIQTDFYRRSQAQPPLKAHYRFEFLADKLAPNYSERDLEEQLAKQLARFLLELGHGFSLVARQQLFRMASGRKLCADWVFYHYRAQCFVVIDLKVERLKHSHIGQLDTYVRLLERDWRSPQDKPTLGLLLCPRLDDSLLLYSALADNPQLFAARYTV